MASSSPFQIQQAPTSIPLFRAWGFLLLPEGLQQASLLMLTGLSAVSSFWGMLTRCQGPGIASYQLLMGLGTHVFVSIPRSKISCVEEKTQVSWNCKQLNCVAMPNKNHFGFQLAVSWRQPFGRCVRQQVLFQNTDCYFTNPCVMVASAAGRQDGCFKSLLNAKI